ncbi:hypothetical protein G6F54_013927 [Rhizopus delemar]|nr:hypothetical protein G6F54_013927 [Rhizopus delemar]
MLASGLGAETAVPVGRRDRGAGALGDQLPGVPLVVGGAGTRATCAGAGEAVVLPLQGNAIALVELAGLHHLHALGLVLLHLLLHVGLAHALRKGGGGEGCDKRRGDGGGHHTV